jgi:Xaa-Pro aminopeptidase
MKTDYKQRIQKVRRSLKKRETLLLAAPHYNPNAYWLTGIESGYALLFTREDAAMYSLNEHSDYAHTKIKDFRKKQLPAYLKQNKTKTLYCDSASLAAAYAHSPTPTKKIEGFRETKDEHEKKLLREAQKATKKTVRQVLEKNLYGKTTNQIAGILELRARENGFALDSFPPIVAVNKDAATPHATPNNEKYRKGDLLLIDCGCTNQHYHADYTTTVYEGRDPEKRRAITAVKQARKAAEKKAVPGAKGSELTLAAKRVLQEYGLHKRFDEIGLGLGHFVGLEVHDCSRRLDKTTLKKGFCFTIEPGVYADYGVRFEDVTIL